MTMQLLLQRRSPSRFDGPKRDNPLAFRYYDPDRIVLGKRMEDHLRFAVCYWHPSPGRAATRSAAGPSCVPGSQADEARARKADVAFEFFRCSACRSSASTTATSRPKARRSRESRRNLAAIVERARSASRASTGIKLLWGTANLFSNRRYMRGAATNPDPDVFAFAAAQVKKAGGHPAARRRELRALGRPRRLRDAAQHRHQARAGPARPLPHMVVEHKKKIGFKGTILIEPKPQRADQAPVRLRRRDRVRLPANVRPRERVKLNIETNHATLAGHSFEHEIAMAAGARHLRLDRHQPRRHAARLGHRPVPATIRRDGARMYRDPERRRLHHRRLQLRRQGAPPVHRPGRPVPWPHRRRWTCARARCSPPSR